MKKAILALFLLLIVGCSIKQGTNKTSFSIGEIAKIDHFTIICENYQKNKLDNNYVEIKLNLKITNNSKNIIFMNPNEYFKLNINDHTYKSNSNTVTIESNKTVDYELVYETIDQEEYNILFYSGVVSNNILLMVK